MIAMTGAMEELEDVVKSMRTEMDNLKVQLALTEETVKKTQDELAWIKEEKELDKEQPYFYACGYHHSGQENITHQTILYDSLPYSSTNLAGGGLDISTGTMTSGYPGTYSVTWSLIADPYGTGTDEFFLRKNGQNIGHSQLWTGKTDIDVVGRTLFLHLDRGDTLDLYCEKCLAHFHRTLFCVSLSTFDLE